MKQGASQQGKTISICSNSTVRIGPGGRSCAPRATGTHHQRYFPFQQFPLGTTDHTSDCVLTADSHSRCRYTSALSLSMLTAQTAVAYLALASTFRLNHDSLSLAASGFSSQYHPITCQTSTHLGLIHITAAPRSEDFPSNVSCLRFFFPLWKSSTNFSPFETTLNWTKSSLCTKVKKKKF